MSNGSWDFPSGVARPSRRRSRARGVSRGTRRRTHRDAALAYSDRHGMPGLLRPQSLCEHFDPRRSRHVARRSDGAGETNQHEGANRRYRLKKSASRDADLTKPRSRPRSHASPGRQGSSGCGGLAPTTACTPEGASTPHDRPAPGQGRHTRRHLRI